MEPSPGALHCFCSVQSLTGTGRCCLPQAVRCRSGKGGSIPLQTCCSQQAARILEFVGLNPKPCLLTVLRSVPLSLVQNGLLPCRAALNLCVAVEKEQQLLFFVQKSKMYQKVPAVSFTCLTEEGPVFSGFVWICYSYPMF